MSVTQLILIATGIVTVLTALVLEIVKLRDALRQLSKRNCVVLGVYGKIPDILESYPVFSSFNRLLRADGKIKILVLRNLSYGLRKCDFVICDHDDEKMVNASNTARISAIIHRDGC